MNEGLGASTKGDGKQPIERTLIEIRYGILDKLEPIWVKKLQERTEYVVDKIMFNNIQHDVADFVPNYNDFRIENSKP